ncbi:MAG: MFS transporter [Pseudomonadota bacterium]
MIKKKEWAWVFYDVGNSAYYTTVVAGFFPIFFKKFWSASANIETTTFQLGLANSLAGLFSALVAPLLGSIADFAGIKRPFLAVFSGIGILACLLFFFIPQGSYVMAMAAFVLGGMALGAAITINDSQLIDVTEPERYHKISALGYSLGYLGGGLLFALNVAMTLKPEFFGLENATEAVRYSFLTVAIWWALFSLPVLIALPDRPTTVGIQAAVKKGIWEIKSTVTDVLKHRNLVLFLLAFSLYIDGVHTVISMAVDYGLSLGFESSDLISALLLVQFIGFPAALVFGRLGDRWGARSALKLGIISYLVITVMASLMQNKVHFFILAACIGAVQGGVQSLSRSYFALLIPKEKSAEFFGFYNMLGKFASILGPVLMGGVAFLTGSTRLSILSLAVLFIAGYYVLEKVQDPAS